MSFPNRLALSKLPKPWPIPPGVAWTDNFYVLFTNHFLAVDLRWVVTREDEASFLLNVSVACPWVALCSCTTPQSSLSFPEIPGTDDEPIFCPKTASETAWKQGRLTGGETAQKINFFIYLFYCSGPGRWYWLWDWGGKRHVSYLMSSSLEATIYFFHWFLLLFDVKWLRAQHHKPANKDIPFPWQLEEVSTYLIPRSKLLPAHIEVSHRVIQIGKDLRSSRPTYEQTLPCQTDPSTKSHIQSFLKHLQGQWLHLEYLPGQPIPMANHTFWKEIPPRVQPHTPLAQLKMMSSLMLGAAFQVLDVTKGWERW